MKDFLAKVLNLSNEIDDYVILNKDENGYYLTYAFKEGSPHHNRTICDGYVVNDKYVGKVLRLYSYTCGWEENPNNTDKHNDLRESWEKYHGENSYIPEDHVCRVGTPAKSCHGKCSKCGKWVLRDCLFTHNPINMDFKVCLSIQQIKDLVDGKI